MRYSEISQFMTPVRYFLALLIIGLQSTTPVQAEEVVIASHSAQADQDHASCVGPDGNTWREYKADGILIRDLIVGSMNVDGRVACASMDGKECAQGVSLSNFSGNPSLLKYVLCENLSGDALNKLSAGPCQYLLNYRLRAKRFKENTMKTYTYFRENVSKLKRSQKTIDHVAKGRRSKNRVSYLADRQQIAIQSLVYQIASYEKNIRTFGGGNNWLINVIQKKQLRQINYLKDELDTLIEAVENNTCERIMPWHRPYRFWFSTPFDQCIGKSYF